MKDVIKVKIVSAERDTYWYADKIGQVINVTPTRYCSGYEWTVKASHFLEASDCVELSQQEVLQYDLQAVKDAVAALEAQMAAIAEEEANKPFTQHQYEKVVAQFRKCAGRKVYTVDNSEWKPSVSISASGVYADSWISSSTFLFGVAFENIEYAKQAIEEVGEDNLRRAWQFEMSIGL